REGYRAGVFLFWAPVARPPRPPPGAPPPPAPPAGPAAPAGPAGPCGPGGPVGTWPDLKSVRSSEPFLTFDEVTALVARSEFPTAPALICALPTLFAGSFDAAYPVPPSATSSATDATAIQGDGRRRPKSFTCSSSV